MTIIASVYAEVVELVDTLDLGSSASRRESSSLSFRTIWGIAKLVRQRVLIPPSVGSSPATPAILQNASLTTGVFVFRLLTICHLLMVHFALAQ